MAGLHNLKPEKVIRALEKANPNILSIPVHKGKTIKIGLLKDQIKKSGLTEGEFLALI